VVVGLIVVALVGGLVAVRSLFGAPADYTGAGTGSVQVTIPQGASASRIGEILVDGDVVASVGAFTDAAAAEPQSRSISPGTYAMAQQMSGAAAVQRLLDPAAKVVAKVVVREGATVVEISDEMVAAGLPKSDIDAVLADPSQLPLPDYADDRVEGFLYPATYTVDPSDTALEVMTAMVDRFNEVAADTNLVERAPAVGLTPYEAVIAASLVEAEVAPEDFGRAARVIFNRLEQGMRLQFDSTVNYGAGTSDLTLDQDQLDSDSPYNTYVIDGLPPTPIGAVSEAALEAVLDPPAGDWIYFVSTDPEAGITKFTASYEEFLQFKAEFQASQQ
jgi:UPF0755 protein